MPLLLHINKDLVIHKFTLKKEGTVTIGRKPDNDIKIDDRTISGHHARIVIRNPKNQFMNSISEVVIEDLGSTNGMYINDTTTKVAILKHDDIIRLGDHTFRYEDEQTNDITSTLIERP